jgi:FAD/FMN-containing dehydrogenase
MFAVVLYLNQNITAEDTERMRRVTEQVIDLAISLDGTFFLPYQLSYSPAQLQQAYPEIEAFFAAKKQYDPDLVLTNTFYETFAPHFAADQ